MSFTDKSYTISALLQKSLQLAGNVSRLEIEVLLSFVLQVSRSYLFAHPSEVLADKQLKTYEQLFEKLAIGMPLPYLTGVKEFWSLELMVNEHTLIPRPETETLVEATLQLWPASEKKVVIDLGVGSGAIAIALAHERPQWDVYGTDQSWQALNIAKQNAAKHQLTNIYLLLTHWCNGLMARQFDAIVSNPPYIEVGDPHLAKLQYEPQAALVAGKDGLEAIKAIILQAKSCLKPGGWLLLEHGYNQAPVVQALMQAAGLIEVHSLLDYQSIERVTLGQSRSSNE